MKHSVKSTTAVVASVVGVLAGVGATLAVGQLAGPNGDPSPATTRVTGPPPPGGGHPYSLNSGEFLPSDANPSPPGPAGVGGHLVWP